MKILEGLTKYFLKKQYCICFLPFAFAKHLEDHHQDRMGDKMAFRFKIARTFRSSLMRQIWEAVKIHGSKATIVLNSKAEWMQPAIDRIVVTREPQEQQQQGGGEAVRRRRAGP